MPKKKADKGVSIQGYFRPILQQNPKLLKQRGNDALYERWLKDHPGEQIPRRSPSGAAPAPSFSRQGSVRIPRTASASVRKACNSVRIFTVRLFWACHHRKAWS